MWNAPPPTDTGDKRLRALRTFRRLLESRDALAMTTRAPSGREAELLEYLDHELAAWWSRYQGDGGSLAEFYAVEGGE